ncbi:hypothetical protein ACTFIT_002958 [Dictyostelium discoideum]
MNIFINLENNISCHYENCIDIWDKIQINISKKTDESNTLGYLPKIIFSYLKEIMKSLYDWGFHSKIYYDINYCFFKNEKKDWFMDRFEEIFPIYKVIIQDENLQIYKELENNYKNTFSSFLQIIKIGISQLTKHLIINHYNFILNNNLQIINNNHNNEFSFNINQIPISSDHLFEWRDQTIKRLSELLVDFKEIFQYINNLINKIIYNLLNINNLDINFFYLQ